MKKLVLVLAILLASCSGDSMDISENVSLYDLTITITTETTKFYGTSVVDVDKKESKVEFFRLTSKQLNAEKKLRPAGTTVEEKDRTPYLFVTRRTVRHNVKISK